MMAFDPKLTGKIMECGHDKYWKDSVYECVKCLENQRRQANAGRELAEAVLDYTANPEMVAKLLKIDALARRVLGKEGRCLMYESISFVDFKRWRKGIKNIKRLSK